MGVRPKQAWRFMADNPIDHHPAQRGEVFTAAGEQLVRIGLVPNTDVV